MASINYATREISCKIVYYGPGLSGKTTNLQIIHRKIPDKDKSEMVSLATETDRTLFFDFLPLDLGSIKGFNTKFQLYTVPGQVYYNATRKLVLRGVDGVVFVVDSQVDKLQENLESFANLQENLREYGHSIENIPLVLQYNKRDLPNVYPVEQLNALVNKHKLPHYEAVAATGVGVFTTLKAIGKSVIDKFNAKYAGMSGTRRPVRPDAPAAPGPAMQKAPPPAFGQTPARPAAQPFTGGFGSPPGAPAGQGPGGQGPASQGLGAQPFGRATPPVPQAPGGPRAPLNVPQSPGGFNGPPGGFGTPGPVFGGPAQGGFGAGMPPAPGNPFGANAPGLSNGPNFPGAAPRQPGPGAAAPGFPGAPGGFNAPSQGFGAGGSNPFAAPAGQGPGGPGPGGQGPASPGLGGAPGAFPFAQNKPGFPPDMRPPMGGPGPGVPQQMGNMGFNPPGGIPVSPFVEGFAGPKPGAPAPGIPGMPPLPVNPFGAGGPGFPVKPPQGGPGVGFPAATGKPPLAPPPGTLGGFGNAPGAFGNAPAGFGNAGQTGFPGSAGPGPGPGASFGPMNNPLGGSPYPSAPGKQGPAFPSLSTPPPPDAKGGDAPPPSRPIGEVEDNSGIVTTYEDMAKDDSFKTKKLPHPSEKKKGFFDGLFKKEK